MENSVRVDVVGMSSDYFYQIISWIEYDAKTDSFVFSYGDSYNDSSNSVEYFRIMPVVFDDGGLRLDTVSVKMTDTAWETTPQFREMLERNGFSENSEYVKMKFTDYQKGKTIIDFPE